MDRKMVQAIADAISEACQPIGEKYGVSITFERGSIGADNATVKFEIATISPNGEVLSQEAVAFKQLARYIGMSPDDLGREFKDRDSIPACWCPTACQKGDSCEEAGQQREIVVHISPRGCEAVLQDHSDEVER